MILYLDTSALIKRYVKEPGTNELSALMDQGSLVGSVLLTQVEMASALAKAVRLNWVDAVDAQKAWKAFLSDWRSFTRLSVTSAVIERASRLAWEYGLRGYDSTHFSAALNWQETLEMRVILVTYDRELWLAAHKTEMPVWPEGLIS